MFRSLTKTRLGILGLAGVAALALAVGAYAYFTTNGTGNSSATVGNPGSGQYTVTVVPTGSVTLYPTVTGDANFTDLIQPYTGVVTNTTSGHEQVNLLTAKITSVTPNANNDACAASNFSLYSATDGVWDVASDGQSATSTTGLPNDLQKGAHLDYAGLAVYLVDQNADQNGCQRATVNLSVTAS
jgi:hypothetical protein